MTKILGWHFAPADRRLGYGDGRLIVDGETLTYAGPVVLCWSGLHASTRIMDALQYARGPVICRVRVSGTVVRGKDKLAGSERTTLWSVDATRALRLHAVATALDALECAGAPDPRSLAALREVTTALRSGAPDAVASVAASAAAWAAASVAASAAAWAAAWDAASAAAWAASRVDANAAANAASRVDAWVAASAAARVAAWDAASNAAASSAAAWVVASRRLRAYVAMQRRGTLMGEIVKLDKRLGGM